MTTKNNYWTCFQSAREISSPTSGIGDRDLFTKRLYKLIKRDFVYDHTSCKGMNHGGIFNLSFSPDGSHLLAATENKSILIFDPLNHKLLTQIDNAHNDAVNYIRFLDPHGRLFAACSDDSCISLWDIRNCKQKLRLLKGHSYWVKNIEYDSAKSTLVSSGYDGCVNVWYINKYGRTDMSAQSNVSVDDADTMNRTCGDCPHTKALYLSCIMRMRLTNDSTKMIICTSEGYIMVIHDLDLETLSEDTKGFQSDLYRLMQKGHSCGLDFGSWHNHLFTAKRNRVELISDFPSENDCQSITSIDVHPSNWAVISRNISKDDVSEWTCVHDIQGDRKPETIKPIQLPKESITNTSGRSTDRLRISHVLSSDDRTRMNLPTSSSPPFSNVAGLNLYQEQSSPVVIISARTWNHRAQATILNPNTSCHPIHPGSPPEIYQNLSRLTHYAPEIHCGPGFIKEICFSPCGRLICSPYGFGFRLLSFNENCGPMTDTAQAQALSVLRLDASHSSYVLTTKFSPRHPTIASGCLGGKVIFYQPVL